MIVQLEDCIDVLTVAYGDKYRYLFLFDHFCGHDRMMENASNTNNMLMGYANKQRTLHATKIIQHDGYLGSYHYLECMDDLQLNVNDTQVFYTQQ